MKRLRDIEEVRERLRATMPIEDVAQALDIELKQSGDNWKGLCPFHVEDTPSFGVSPDKGLFYCFGCKAGGDVFKLVEMYETLTHIEAIYRIAEIVGVDLREYEREPTAEEKKLARYYEINEQRHAIAVADAANKNARAWLKKRRFDKGVMERYGVGYSAAPGDKPDDVIVTQAEWKALGLWRSAQWGNAIVVPLRDHMGNIVGFRNRPLDGDVKVVGPDEDKHPIPMIEIYGLYEARKAIRDHGSVILVEGEPDVWQMASNGFENVVAMIGTKLNEKMVQQLRDLNIRHVILMADGDEAGRKFSRRVAEAWKEKDISLKIVPTRDGDPDEILLTAGPQAINEDLMMAKYSFEYLVDSVIAQHYIGSMTDKIDVMHAMKKYIANASTFERDMMITLLAEKLKLDRDGMKDFYIESQEANSEAAPLHNLRAEKVVLKRMIEDESFAGEAVMGLQGDDFYMNKHRQMFDVLCDMYRRQRDIDIDTVTTEMGNRFGPSSVSTIKSIMHNDVRTDSASSMMEDVRDKATRRDIQKRARDIVVRMNDTSVAARETIQQFSAGLARAVVGSGDAISESATLVNDLMDQTFDRIKDPNLIVGLDLGRDFFTLNTALHGLQTKRYAIFAAASGVGKTAFACSVARRAAVDLEVPTTIFTFETGKEALTLRMVSALSGVESDKIITGFLTPEELAEVQTAAALIGGAPLTITERGRSIEECVSIMRSEVLRKGTKLAIVDYIQLMHASSRENRADRRDQELGNISRIFLETAGELDITVLALAQLNREAAKTGNQTGEQMGESYKIKQDADIVITAREKTKEEIASDGPEKGNRIFLLDKNRHGRQGIYFDVQADLEVMRLYEVAK